MEAISYVDAKAKGLKRYFTGKPCKNGHLSERFVSNCGCAECAYGRTEKWNKKNPELKQEFYRDWYARNPDYHLLWKKKHPDAQRIAAQKWYRANTDREIAKAVKWRKNNLEKKPCHNAQPNGVKEKCAWITHRVRSGGHAQATKLEMRSLRRLNQKETPH